MFTKARVHLTLWYLILIIAISSSFSLFVYRQVMSEVKRSLRQHTLRLIPGKSYPVIVPSPYDDIDIEIYEELRRRIILQLLIINTGIAGLSTVLGYFLAGKTLHPIEQMVEDQKRFVSDASHELRTPLTAMKTEIEVTLMDKNISSADAKRILESNLEEIARMQKLTNYLLNLNKYQDNSLALQTENVDIKDVIEKAVLRLEPIIKEKGIQLSLNLKNITLKGNAISLEELATILIDNAVKYSKKKAEVTVRSKIKKHTVIVEVEDFGIGIKENEIPFIFNRFFRADSSRTKSEIDGYGLGLSIAKQIVDLHHGNIQVKSVEGKGTTFIVSLPE